MSWCEQCAEDRIAELEAENKKLRELLTPHYTDPYIKGEIEGKW